jgi:hypothetical protein
MAPLLLKWAATLRGRTSHSFADTPGVWDLVSGVAPPVLVVPVALAIFVAWAAGGRPAQREGARRHSILLVVSWALFPPLFCFAISIATETKLYVPRYYIASAPGLALAAGWLIRDCLRPAARVVAGGLIAAAAIVSFGGPFHAVEDWSGAMRAARAAAGNSEIPVLVASGFVEASTPAALADPEMGDAFFAPLYMYPAKGRVIRLPFRADEGSTQYLEGIVKANLERQPRFLFIGRWKGVNFAPWLSRRLAPAGFRSRSLGDFGSVIVVLYQRPEPLALDRAKR